MLSQQQESSFLNINQVSLNCSQLLNISQRQLDKTNKMQSLIIGNQGLAPLPCTPSLSSCLFSQLAVDVESKFLEMDYLGLHLGFTSFQLGKLKNLSVPHLKINDRMECTSESIGLKAPIFCCCLFCFCVSCFLYQDCSTWILLTFSSISCFQFKVCSSEISLLISLFFTLISSNFNNCHIVLIYLLHFFT